MFLDVRAWMGRGEEPVKASKYYAVYVVWYLMSSRESRAAGGGRGGVHCAKPGAGIED
jgi:hypothetical protein